MDNSVCFHTHEPKLVLSEERRKDTENIDNVNPKRYKEGSEVGLIDQQTTL